MDVKQGNIQTHPRICSSFIKSGTDAKEIFP